MGKLVNIANRYLLKESEESSVDSELSSAMSEIDSISSDIESMDTEGGETAIEEEEESSGIDLKPILAKLAEFTKNNNVYDAWKVIARDVLKDKPLADSFDLVAQLHHYHKHLTPGLKATRQELIDAATMLAKNKVTPSEWQKLYSSL